MRTVTAEWARTITRPHRIDTEVTSWRDGVQLGTVMRPTSGQITYDATARLRRRVTLTFPAAGELGLAAGVPDDPEHPLSPYGQRLRISTGVVHPATGAVELVPQGWYLITGWDWSATGDEIEVRAEDLRRLLDDARFWYPASQADLAPTSRAYSVQYNALATEFLLPAQQLNVSSASGLPAGQVAIDRVYGTDRTAEIDTLTREWGVQWYVDDDGWAVARPLYDAITPDTPAVWTLTDGQDGTVIDRATGADRARFANILTATGKVPPGAAAGSPPVVTILWGDPRGVTSWWSPMGQMVAGESHPTITTVPELAAWGRARLVQLVRPAVQHTVIALPDPSLELGDVGHVITADGTITGRITAITLPLTAGDGAMRLTVSSGDYGTAEIES